MQKHLFTYARNASIDVISSTFVIFVIAHIITYAINIFKLQ